MLNINKCFTSFIDYVSTCKCSFTVIKVYLPHHQAIADFEYFLKLLSAALTLCVGNFSVRLSINQLTPFWWTYNNLI